MRVKKLLLITELEGFNPHIGKLVSMMNYARWTTLQAVDGLTIPELDHLHDAESNSIGALLLHIAAVEFSYQLSTFHGRGLTEAERLEWSPALELGDWGRREIKGHPLKDYLDRLQTVREETLQALKRRDDGWLFMERPFWGGRPANHYFMWFHVFEDEINHRGQIRWLRKRLPTSRSRK